MIKTKNITQKVSGVNYDVERQKIVLSWKQPHMYSIVFDVESTILVCLHAQHYNRAPANTTNLLYSKARTSTFN